MLLSLWLLLSLGLDQGILAWLAKELIVAGWLVDRCLASKEPDKN